MKSELNLEDSEARADITCRDYIAAYLKQYSTDDEREAFESFCRSAVIDVTSWPGDEMLVGTLYNRLDPDGRDANITVAEAGRRALNES